MPGNTPTGVDMDDLRRVAAVGPLLPYGEGEDVHASGLRITDALVLTVAHVLTVGRRTARQAWVIFADQPEIRYRAHVVLNSRRRPAPGADTGLDLAVLRLDDRDVDGLARVGPVRWGEYSLNGRHRVTGVGFPGFERRLHSTTPRTITGVIDVARLPWQGVFMLERTDGDASLTTGYRQADGLSGTAVHSEDRSLVIGVVFQQERQHSRLAVMPASRLLRDAELRRLVQDQGGDPDPAPVLLDSLLTRPPAAAASPAALLDPARRLTPLLPPTVDTLEELLAWLNEPNPVALLHGPAHSGKTRVAHELLTQCWSAGWNAGFIARTPHPGHRADKVLPQLDRNTLLIVDELETRPRDWDTLRHALPRDGHVKLLGIARTPHWRGQASQTRVSEATAVPSDLLPHLQEPLRLVLGVPTELELTDATPTTARAHRQESLPVAEALAHALSGLLSGGTDRFDPQEPHRILLAHEHRYATRALQAELPWMKPDLCKALLVACAYFDATEKADTIADIRAILQNHLGAVPGFDLSRPTFVDALFVHSLSEALARLYPSEDGAHRGRMPQSVRQAQDAYAAVHHPALKSSLLQAQRPERLAQYEALARSSDRPSSADKPRWARGGGPTPRGDRRRDPPDAPGTPRPRTPPSPAREATMPPQHANPPPRARSRHRGLPPPHHRPPPPDLRGGRGF
ncbi:trypsin-like peptidase domain-containing protein [Streptomyces sp. SLBN-115]|uniref:trypsin-like peptidase domain-containing protein n=1 Tax=Streptomyces sp. SLBN-115 TaxID=2768453 RepID=UPI0011522D8D|nr:trypsin-like peptidase domain-containing protein [Streptomyces sp. SLBN-115]TQJ37690.1 trypsin-like peptidase [Streptomyces sp. SLBN-115]